MRLNCAVQARRLLSAGEAEVLFVPLERTDMLRPLMAKI